MLLRYSNQKLPEVDGESAPDLQEQAFDVERESKSGRAAATRITDRLRKEVLGRYQAGQSSRQVALDLGIAKSTVLDILGEAGESRPTNKILTEQQVAEARKLRAEGWLFREIGEHFGVHKETVRKRLLGP